MWRVFVCYPDILSLLINSHDFLRQCWLDWLQANSDEVVRDLFGYHAIQLGLPELNGLSTNRMPHQWLAQVDSYGPECRALGAAPGAEVDLDCDSHALPFESASLDLVVMPHTLERAADPHATLREVARVLMPEGHVVIAGLNPFSLWSVRQSRFDWSQRFGLKGGAQFAPFDVAAKHWIGLWRLRDWLKLLGFEVQLVKTGMYRPGVASSKWAKRWAWLERWGAKLWPFAGGVYMLVAVKKVRGMRVMGPSWSRKRVRGRARVAAKQPARVMNDNSFP